MGGLSSVCSTYSKTWGTNQCYQRQMCSHTSIQTASGLLQCESLTAQRWTHWAPEPPAVNRIIESLDTLQMLLLCLVQMLLLPGAGVFVLKRMWRTCPLWCFVHSCTTSLTLCGSLTSSDHRKSIAVISTAEQHILHYLLSICPQLTFFVIIGYFKLLSPSRGFNVKREKLQYIE